MTHDEKVNALIDTGIVFDSDEAEAFLDDMGMSGDDDFNWE
jgi:hypothetical protein